MEKNLKYPRSIENNTQLPSIHLLGPQIPFLLVFGSNLVLSLTENNFKYLNNTFNHVELNHWL